MATTKQGIVLYLSRGGPFCGRQTASGLVATSATIVHQADLDTTDRFINKDRLAPSITVSSRTSTIPTPGCISLTCLLQSNTMAVYPDSEKGYTHLSKQVACSDDSPAWATLELIAISTNPIAAQLLFGDAAKARASSTAETKALQKRLRDLRTAGLPHNFTEAEAAWKRAIPLLHDLAADVAGRSPKDHRWRHRKTKNTNKPVLKGTIEITIPNDVSSLLDSIASQTPGAWPTYTGLATDCKHNPVLLDIFFVIQLVIPFAIHTSYEMQLPHECDDNMDVDGTIDYEEHTRSEPGSEASTMVGAETITCSYPPATWVQRHRRKVEQILGREGAVDALLKHISDEERQTKWGQREEFTF
jgi:hypothetical protein